VPNVAHGGKTPPIVGLKRIFPEAGWEKGSSLVASIRTILTIFRCPRESYVRLTKVEHITKVESL